MIDRRTFLGGVAAGVGAAKGEAPVRSTPLRANFWGPLYYDEKERQEVVDVLETGRPFRWYGPGTQPPMKVATFEKEFAAWMRTRYALARPGAQAGALWRCARPRARPRKSAACAGEVWRTADTVFSWICEDSFGAGIDGSSGMAVQRVNREKIALPFTIWMRPKSELAFWLVQKMGLR